MSHGAGSPALRAACDVCGETMRRGWSSDGMELTQWLDENGSPLGGGPTAGETLDELLRLFAGNPELRGSDLHVQLYATASVALGQHVGMPWQHVHRVSATPYQGEAVPECCGWPMRLVRDGWACRYPLFDCQRVAA